MSDTARTPKPRFRIYRAEDSVEVTKDLMPLVNMKDDDASGVKAMMAAGFGDGAHSRVLMGDEATGLSLTYARFKAGLVLPRHSHDADCAYYVISGEAHLGTAVLKTGDAFVVPANHGYSFEAGPDGVEIMEFRNAVHFHFKFNNNTPAFWEKIVSAAEANHEEWRETPAAVAEKRMREGATAGA